MSEIKRYSLSDFEKVPGLVARTQVGDSVISTVKLPRVSGGFCFESMVFKGNLPEQVDRYDSRQRAEQGHIILIVELLKEETNERD
jgi:hypothetical protein